MFFLLECKEFILGQSLLTVKIFGAKAHAFSDKGSSNFTDLHFFNPSIFEALIAFLPNGGFMSIDQIVQLACLPNSYIVVLHRNFKI